MSQLKYKVRKNERESRYFGLITALLVTAVIVALVYGAIQLKSYMNDTFGTVYDDQTAQS